MLVGCIEIPMMTSSTGRTYPFSYPQGTQSTRTSPCKTSRASNTGERLVDFDILHAKPIGFISKHAAKLTPSRIKRGFSQRTLIIPVARNIADSDHLGAVDNCGCCSCAPNPYDGIADLGVYFFDEPLFMGTLCQAKASA